MANRPHVPRELERSVLVEAGHRCAIPPCRQTPVEVSHIVPYTSVNDHTFDNLIALCPTCHTRYDHGEIDRKSMLQYKANLSILNSRYSDLERRILEEFVEDQSKTAIQLSWTLEPLYRYLIKDGILKFDGVAPRVSLSGILSVPAGHNFVYLCKNMVWNVPSDLR